MIALVLDTRAVELLADPKVDLQAARRMRDILDSADQMGIPVRIPSAVLAEAYRGIPADAAVDRVLGHGIRPITLGQAAARQAGGLRHRDRLDSCHTVDALVVATAIRLGGGVIATGDPAFHRFPEPCAQLVPRPTRTGQSAWSVRPSG